jgi:hypothetical protein
MRRGKKRRFDISEEDEQLFRDADQALTLLKEREAKKSISEERALPTQILAHVFQYLSLEDITRTSETSTHFRDAGASHLRKYGVVPRLGETQLQALLRRPQERNPKQYYFDPVWYRFLGAQCLPRILSVVLKTGGAATSLQPPMRHSCLGVFYRYPKVFDRLVWMFGWHVDEYGDLEQGFTLEFLSTPHVLKGLEMLRKARLRALIPATQSFANLTHFAYTLSLLTLYKASALDLEVLQDWSLVEWLGVNVELCDYLRRRVANGVDVAHIREFFHGLIGVTIRAMVIRNIFPRDWSDSRQTDMFRKLLLENSSARRRDLLNLIKVGPQ